MNDNIDDSNKSKTVVPTRRQHSSSAGKAALDQFCATQVQQHQHHHHHQQQQQQQGKLATRYRRGIEDEDDDDYNSVDTNTSNSNRIRTTTTKIVHNSTTTNSSSIIHEIDETRPGAVHVEGTTNTSAEDSFYYTQQPQEQQQDGDPNTTETVIQAETLEEGAARYQAIARQKVRERIAAESAQATQVQEVPTTVSSPIRNHKRTAVLWGVVMILFVVVMGVVGVVVVRLGGSSNNDQQQPQEQPPLDQDSKTKRDFDYLRRQLIQSSVSTSGSFWFNTSSQYQALSWLIYDDPARLDIPNTPLSILIDRYVLAVFYFATNGDEWTNNDDYLDESSVCHWRGIKCDSRESVTALDLGM